jgi:vitamin B12 transporter
MRRSLVHFSSSALKARRRRRLVVSASLLAATIASRAEAQQTAAPPVVLPELVVSPTAIPTPQAQTASAVTVITSADMEREQRRTAADALSTVPGLNLIQQGGAGGLTTVFTRGTSPNHTKILIDGIDVSDPSNTNRVYDLGQLLTGDIDRIEVLRGPQSGLYGSDALGGVISITTKRGDGPPKIAGTLEGGSFGTFNQTLGASGSSGRFDYAFNILHFHAASTPVTPLELLPPGQKRINDYYDNATFSTKLGAQINDTLRFNYVARYTESTLRFTGDDFSVFPSVPAAAQSTQVLHQFSTRAEAVWSLWDGRFVNHFGASYVNDWSWNRTPADAFTPASTTINAGERTKVDWRGDLTLTQGNMLLFGLEREVERLHTDTDNASNGNSAGYIELQSNPLKNFFLTANVRLDDNDQFGDHTTWRVAPVYIVGPTDTKLKISYGTGFKAPTLSQLYVDFPAFGFIANRNLRPEQSTGYDAGFEQPLFNDRLRFGATYFHNDITDLISFNDTFTTNINIGRATTEGVETFVSAKLTDQVSMRADYTYTNARDDLTGLELLRRPRDKASATVTWTPRDDFSLSGTVLHVGPWIDVSRDGQTTGLTAPGFTVVNLAANYKVNKNVQVFARADNLFNQHYQDPTGFLRPGLGVYGGVRLNN